MKSLVLHPLTVFSSTLKPETLAKKQKAQQKISEERTAAKVTRKAVRIIQQPLPLVFRDANSTSVYD